MFNSIKKFLQNAREEAEKQYSIGPGDEFENSHPKPWIGIDLDGTLAHHDENSSIDVIGEPVPAMVEFIRKMVRNEMRIKIFTARAMDAEQLPLIREWLKENDLPELEITNIKDFGMTMLYDDRCVQVEKNTGRFINE